MDAWSVAAQALDHHDTVGALSAALSAEGLGATFGEQADQIAEQIAANLARVGLALVPLNGGTLLADLERQVDTQLKDEAASSWFSRNGD